MQQKDQIDETFLETDRDFLSAFSNCNLSRKIVDKLIRVVKISAIYIVWICLHYVSSYLYIQLCVPYSWVGFFASPFLITSPHCKAFRWMIYTGASIIENMWLLLGIWICSNILKN
jgi:hypothetical protein